MGSIKVSPKNIMPSQDFLKPDTVAFIFDCIANDKTELLPPDPIVREDSSGNLVAIDGHNLIAARLYLGEDIEVRVAKFADDGLPPTSEANERRNRDLRDKFDTVFAERDRLQGRGVATFYDLIAKYPDLFHS